MRVLIVHEEARLVAGAQRMLRYFLEGVKISSDVEVTVAAVRESRFSETLPCDMDKIWIPPKKAFSAVVLWRQLRALLEVHRQRPFDVVHGWAARDWELTAAFQWRTGVPALATLHDHPAARFHSRFRRSLMRASARYGLEKIVCVSEAVRAACLQAGYPRGKVEVAHNGLPPAGAPARRISKDRPFCLGYLGVFSERKGMRELFLLLDELARLSAESCQMQLAGGTQDSESERFMERLRREFGDREWWSRVRWCGWTEKPAEFLQTTDLLIVPSSEFDPFPTVLLEAGQQALPVLAAAVGGIPEIVVDGETGWLFDPSFPAEGARRIAELLAAPERCLTAGRQAAARIRDVFSVGKMVARYTELYSTLISND